MKLEWSNNTYGTGTDAKNYLSYTIANGWTLVPGETNVYYRTVNSAQMSSDNGVNNAYPVLADNKVTVSGEITKEQMNAFTNDNLPKLTITAYASQYMKNNTEFFTAAEAWVNVQPATTP